MALMYSHLITVVPCFFLGTWLMLATKGTINHKSLGKVYLILMFVTALITLFMPAVVGPQFLGHFGWIHLLSVLVLYTAPTAYRAARKGDIKTHQRKMILLYFGALIIAGGFTFYPGRYLHEVFFGAP
jgi:uncharacterized membrane protein